MNALRFQTSTLAFVFLLVSPVRADQTDLSRLAWLGGCWQGEGAEPGSGEHWMPLAGGTLLGVSRTVKQGRTVAHEFMKIAVFENPRHDFPQRVIYRLAGATLKARIEGLQDGTPVVVRFPMRRVSCDALLPGATATSP